MKDIDEKIRNALQNEDRELFDKYAGEMSLIEQVVQTFKGRSKMMIVAGMIIGIVFMGLGIYCAVQYFKSDMINERLTWAVGFMMTMISVAMLKIWYWMELNRLSITRDIKRLELRLTQITKNIEK